MRLSVYTRLDPGFSLCRDMRTQIFVDEHNVPVSYERDAQDYRAAHYIIRHSDNTPIGVARSYVEGDFCKIQRFGLLPPYRNDAIRQQAFALILKDCSSRYPFMPMNVYAQAHQEEFYAAFGFVPEGEKFVYADFVLRNMILPSAKTNAANQQSTFLENPVEMALHHAF